MSESRKNNKVLVSLAIGDRYQDVWQRFFRPSWEAYAKAHGYDIIVIEDYIDPAPEARQRKPHWQKCLILEDERCRAYDHVVWLDTDILINWHSAPCIVSSAPEDGIGCVTFRGRYATQQSLDNGDKRQADFIERMSGQAVHRGPLGIYAKCGFEGAPDDFCNTGVMTFRPDRDRAVMRHIYDSYGPTPYSDKPEPPMSYHLLKEGLIRPLDARFNAILPEILFEHYPFLVTLPDEAKAPLAPYCLTAAYHNAFFLHFIIAQGTIQYLRYLNPALESPFVRFGG
ncbi:MAG: hypothetical protein ACPGNT_04405 [Rhodospirillales bacterium]